jgi:glycosyltransferase involved in cell wall biosynthesis
MIPVLSIEPFMHLLVLSHLRWNFVYQRPQHLLSRCAKQNPVFFWEEPEYLDGVQPTLAISDPQPNLKVIVPQLPHGLSESENFRVQEQLLTGFLSSQGRDIDQLVLWYYTPMSRNFTRQVEADCVVYDCMDELSAFRGAPPGLRAAEAELLQAADLVFTGGQSLHESKRDRHPSVHCFPSSIEFSHFAQARSGIEEPADQARIPHPKLGFCGVIDERMDVELITSIADLRREWQIVMIGPVVKISEADLPRPGNIHWLGGRKYDELPAYLSGWDVALLPFALNESTKFISPTKTPEYLAAGLPVVSTPITDVVRPYGDLGLVSIARTAEEFVAESEKFLAQRSPQAEQKRLAQVDAFLARSSWQQTWEKMSALIQETLESKGARADKSQIQEERKLAAGTLANAD